MTAEQNFWEEVQSLLSFAEPVVPTFRLYYNEQGMPIVYTMEELNGNYIEVDRETYLAASMNVKVQDNKLIKIDPARSFRKLVPSDSGTPCDPDNVAIVVGQNQPHTLWSLNVSN